MPKERSKFAELAGRAVEAAVREAAYAITDVRQRVVEEGYFGRITTPRLHGETIGQARHEQVYGNPNVTTGGDHNRADDRERSASEPPASSEGHEPADPPKPDREAEPEEGEEQER